MIRITVPSAQSDRIRSACLRWGRYETGGVLFGEHTGEYQFRIAYVSVAPRGRGLVASFVRTVKHVKSATARFYRKTQGNYERFNYLGEWHSHPSFELEPSSVDDASMWDMVVDPAVGARFVVLMIVKLDGSAALQASAWAYAGPNIREPIELIFE